MFDLMGAIRRKQNIHTPPPADSAKTAESPQPRDGELAEGLRKTADKSEARIFSATIRKLPQTAKTRQPPKTKGSRQFSANPQNPQPIVGKNKQNPDAVLLEIAQALKADAHMLRALLSDDDMQAIADGEYSRELLAAYFKQMRKDGKELVDLQWHLDHLVHAGMESARQKTKNAAEWDKAWRAAHERFMNHLTACPDCYAPRGRYCSTGQDLRRDYLNTYQNKGEPAQ